MSVPLVSTQSILNLIFDLFEKHPQTVPLIARVIEAEECSEENNEYIRNFLAENFNISRDFLDGLPQHIAIDYTLGHTNLI
jgi:hypothetical protein